MKEVFEEIFCYAFAITLLILFIITLPAAALFAGVVYVIFKIPDIVEWFMEQKRLIKGLIVYGILCVVLLGVGIYNNVRYDSFETRSYAEESYTVYKTVTGKCYHRKGCGYLRTCIETTKAKAIRDGLYPCSRCNP